ncbi:MAG TPA: hypothetical protein VLB67_00985 [Acidimicrobiia bacterium]|nr:hypothetical protein [Acidimicrobiia bacterium]
MAMSDEHKAALARGRREGRAVKQYLKMVGSRRPGRPVTKESLQKRIDGLNEKIDAEEDPLKRLEMIQSRLDAEDQMSELDESLDADAIEKEFIEVASSYSDRKGITYSAWREAGVSAQTLREAGIARTRRA